ncbi:MAG: response regulator [bacterium]
MDKNIKIMLADDSAFMRNILKDILISAGYSNFSECSNGRECLEMLKSDKPALLLLDMIMPEITGMDVLKQMEKNVKVLVISAIGQNEMINEAKTNGALGYIVKPFENPQVIQEVERVLAI